MPMRPDRNHKWSAPDAANFDANNNPVILSGDHNDAEQTPSRTWTVVRRNGEQWDYPDVCKAYHNYDMGSLHVDEDGTMRIVAPTAPESVMWGGAVEKSHNGSASITERPGAKRLV